MTYMQIAQFLLGLPMALIYIVLPDCIQKKAHVDDIIAKVFALNAHQSQSLAFAFTFSYVSYLVVLFFEFARRNYGSKAAVVGAAGKAKKTAEKVRAEIPKKSGAKQQRGRKSVAPKEKAAVAAKKSAPSKSRGRKPKVVVATSPSPARVTRAAATTTKKSPIRRKSALKAKEAIKRK